MTRTAGFGFALVAAACAVVAALQLNAPPYADLYWQLPEGAQVLAGKLPSTVPYAIEAGRWVDHEWLFEAVAAFCRQHGAYAVFAVFCDLAFAAYPLLIYALLRRRYGDVASAAVALLAAAGIFFTNPYRPQTFAYYCFTIVANELDEERPKAWRAGLAALLWANLHASAVLVPLLGLIYVAGAIKTRLPRERLVAILWCAGAAALATLFTPHGFGLWTYALGVAYAPFTQYIREWRPLGFEQPEARYVFLPVVALLVAGGLRVERRKTTPLLLVATFLTLAALHVRQVAFLVPAIAPVLAGAIERIPIAGRLSAAPFVDRFAFGPARAALLAVVLFAVVVGTALAGASPPALSPELSGPSADLLALATSVGPDGNAYVDRPYAAVLPYSGLPTRLLIDSHADPYDAAVWNDATALERLQPGFAGVLERRKLRLVLVANDSSLAQAMPFVHGWHAAGTRGRWIAFVRD